jgi:hypothetical protein
MPIITPFDVDKARVHGCILWADGTNNCYWLCVNAEERPLYEQELHFHWYNEAKAFCVANSIELTEDSGEQLHANHIAIRQMLEDDPCTDYARIHSSER